MQVFPLPESGSAFLRCQALLQHSSRPLTALTQWHSVDAIGHIPAVDVRIGFHSTALCVRFDVVDTPKTWRCECRNDQEPVWQDSCCEIFLQQPDGSYLNVECNPLGFVLSARGKSRQDRVSLQPDELQQITRLQEGSLVRFQYLEIPFSLLALDGPPPLLRGNAYKCADKAEVRHWMSLFSVQSVAPDFHRPDFFGTLHLQH